MPAIQKPNQSYKPGLLMPIGYHPLSCSILCCVSHLFQHLSLLEDPVCIPVSQDGTFFWRCRSFYLVSRSFLLPAPHLLIPVFPTQVGPFLFYSFAQRDLWTSFLSTVFTLPAFFLSQIRWIPWKMQRSCSPWSFKPWRMGVFELLLFEGPGAFDFLGVQKWELWWEDPPPKFLRGYLCPGP